MFRPVLEVMMETRPELRKRSLMIRKMLARFQPKLANFPLEHGYPAEPVTWNNLHRWTPLFSYYGHKLLLRAGAGHRDKQPIKKSSLWQTEQVRDVLQPGSMKVAAIMDQQALTAFVSQVQDGVTPVSNEANRLLGLEWVLGKLSSLR